LSSEKRREIADWKIEDRGGRESFPEATLDPFGMVMGRGVRQGQGRENVPLPYAEVNGQDKWVEDKWEDKWVGSRFKS